MGSRYLIPGRIEFVTTANPRGFFIPEKWRGDEGGAENV
jgi:hypothetical protein